MFPWRIRQFQPQPRISEFVFETFEIADHIFLLGPSKNGAVLVGSGSPKEITDNKDSYVQQFIQGNHNGPIEFHYPTESKKFFFYK